LIEKLLQSFFLVFLGEMGDKTQLLTLLLVAKFKKPVPIFFGILFATLLNHALASYVGVAVTNFVQPHILKWILCATFIGFGLWILVPDSASQLETKNKFGAFSTTLVTFFIAEMGDKTQLATIALGAKISSGVVVTIGTTLGMMAANGLALVFGQKFLERVPLKIVNRVASGLFILFGVGIAVGF
jgi:Ca2+/H+ antiporter, TMEM165/GDT1 family